MDPPSEWQTKLGLSFGDLDADKAANGREVWPVMSLQVIDPETDWELEFNFDRPISTIIEATARAILAATDGAVARTVPVVWYYR